MLGLKKPFLFIVLLLFSLHIAAAAVDFDQPFAYYSFDNGTYNATHFFDQENSNDMERIDTTFLPGVQGFLNEGLVFDQCPNCSGANKLRVPSFQPNLANGGGMAVNLWINSSSFSDFGYFANDKDGFFYLAVNAGGLFDALICEDHVCNNGIGWLTDVSAHNLTSANWTMITWVYEPVPPINMFDLKLYINGVEHVPLVGENNSFGVMPGVNMSAVDWNANPWHFFSNTPAPQLGDELRIYDDALEASEVMALFDNTVNPPAPEEAPATTDTSNEQTIFITLIAIGILFAIVSQTGLLRDVELGGRSAQDFLNMILFVVAMIVIALVIVGLI